MRAAPALLISCLVLSPTCLPVLAQQPAQQSISLTVEKIFGRVSPYGHPPADVTWSPDSKHLTYMDGGEMVDLDPVTGKPHVLVSRQKLATLSAGTASERERDHRARYGMADYIWAPDSAHLLFDSNGRLWLFDLKNGTGVEIGFAGMAAGDNPKFSPNGESISFVKQHNLAVVDLRAPGTPTHILAESKSDSLLNGEVDWVYAEELDVRSNYFWSPDSKNIAFLQMNEESVPLYPLTDWIPTHAQVAMQHYPQPGDNNPAVRVGVVSASGGKTAWVKLPLDEDKYYIPRFGWIDHKNLWIEALTRDHQHRFIFFADPQTGSVRQALDISDDKFLDENYDITIRDGIIAFTNWKDGHNHIYLYSYDQGDPLSAPATLQKQLTSGDFDVAKMVRVDPKAKIVDYLSNEGNPLEMQLWQVDFEGRRKQISSGEGTHEVDYSPHGTEYVDDFSTRMNPGTRALCTADQKCRVFWETHALDAYGLRAPEQLTVKAHDGTTLYATLLLPAGKTDPASVPLIVNPYGGPGPQTVANKWASGLLFDELLAEHGFAVLHADNRGTGMRGRDFAQACFHNFGAIQFEDQMTVVDDVLAKFPQLDPKRLGWWGWSWGGTFTLYAMSHSDRFRAGVSVAPVTDFRNYDSIYTERYLGLPSENPDVYDAAAVSNTAGQLHGRLLLVHGTGDDNVHIENTIQYIQKLIEAQIPYDLQLYPRKTHSISGPDVRTHLYTRILAQFEQYLMPTAP